MHLTKFWKGFNLFSDDQFGFREKSSITWPAVVHFYERLLQHKDTHDVACVIFLDIAKAF